MPFVLVTSRAKIDKYTRSEDRLAQAKGLLRVGSVVLRLLESRFAADDFQVLGYFPGEGSKIARGHRRVAPADLEGAWRANDLGSHPPFENPLGVEGGVRLDHVVELRGTFRLAEDSVVPATLSVNLSPAWSETQGDVEFETLDTAAHPEASLASLLRSNRRAAEPFVRQLMRGLSKANDDRLPIKIRWAAIQDSEGAIEGRDFLTQYRHYETTLRPLLSAALEDTIQSEFADTLSREEAQRPVTAAAADAVVKDLVREMGETKDFASALGSLQTRFGVEAAEVGSVIFTTWETGAIDRMAEYVVSELGRPEIRRALETRLGLVDNWGRKFARIAANAHKSLPSFEDKT